MTERTHFGDTEMGQGIGCLGICIGLFLLMYGCSITRRDAPHAEKPAQQEAPK